jgi:hypothetical protein
MVILGKEIPVQAWTGPEGSRRLRLPDFKDKRNMKGLFTHQEIFLVLISVRVLFDPEAIVRH